jgi:hypothetical protein
LALVQVLDALEAVEAYLLVKEEGSAHKEGKPAPAASMEVARRVREQNVVEEEDAGPPVLRRGVARERLAPVEDPQMRHGRKSRSVRFSSYKRHVFVI